MTEGKPGVVRPWELLVERAVCVADVGTVGGRCEADAELVVFGASLMGLIGEGGEGGPPNRLISSIQIEASSDWSPLLALRIDEWEVRRRIE